MGASPPNCTGRASPQDNRREGRRDADGKGFHLIDRDKLSVVRTFAQERLASYKCPKRVVTLEKLPRNAMGKVQRSLLAK